MERDRGRIVDAYEHNVGSVYLCQDVNASAWPECDERGYDTDYQFTTTGEHAQKASQRLNYRKLL